MFTVKVPTSPLRQASTHRTTPASSVARPSRRGKKSKRPSKSSTAVTTGTAAIKSAGAPVSLRSLSKIHVGAISDTVTASRRFSGNSRCCAVAPDGTAWTGEVDGSIVLRLVPSGAEVVRIPPSGRATATVIERVAGSMWVGFSDGAIRVFDVETQQQKQESRQHTAAIYAICTVGDSVYTGGADWKIHQWEAADMNHRRMLSGHKNSVRCLTPYRDPESNRWCLASGSDDGTVKIWDTQASPPRSVKSAAAEAEREGRCIATLDGQCRSVRCLAVWQDTAELWVGSEDTVIRVWDLYSMTVMAVITAHRAPVVSLQQVEDSVWSGSTDGTVAVTDRYSKDLIFRAAQPPTSTGVGLRDVMVIAPVSRTIIHNVWTTAADGSWQCWAYKTEESSVATTMPCMVNFSQPVSSIRTARNGSASVRRETSTRRAGSESMKEVSSAVLDGDGNNDNGELRESVARTRRSINTLLAESADCGFVSFNMENGNESEDAPIDAFVASIRDDRRAELAKEVSQCKIQVAQEEKKAERLRTKLAKVQNATTVPPQLPTTTPTRTENASKPDGRHPSPTTEALASLSSRLTELKAQNEVIEKQIAAGKKRYVDPI